MKKNKDQVEDALIDGKEPEEVQSEMVVKKKLDIFNLFYSGAAVVILIGVIAKLLEWPAQDLLITAGLTIEAIVFGVSAVKFVEVQVKREVATEETLAKLAEGISAISGSMTEGSGDDNSSTYVNIQTGLVGSDVAAMVPGSMAPGAMIPGSMAPAGPAPFSLDNYRTDKKVDEVKVSIGTPSMPNETKVDSSNVTIEINPSMNKNLDSFSNQQAATSIGTNATQQFSELEKLAITSLIKDQYFQPQWIKLDENEYASLSNIVKRVFDKKIATKESTLILSQFKVELPSLTMSDLQLKSPSELTENELDLLFTAMANIKFTNLFDYFVVESFESKYQIRNKEVNETVAFGGEDSKLITHCNTYFSTALQMQGGITVAEANINITGTGINNDGVLRNISGINTFSGTLNLTGGSRIYVDAGTLSMTSAGTSISMGTYTLTVGGPSTGIISVGGVITSAGSGGVLTKDGASTSYLYLSGNNTYTGNTVVSSGVLNIQHTNALGTTAGTTSISSEAALEIQGGITLTTETINNSSKGITNTTGGIRSISGNNTIPGIITSAAASRINVDQDDLTLTNSTSAIVLTSTNIIGGAGNIIVTGKVTGASSLTMDGTGILTLSATTNDYTGQTIITSGMVKINNDNSLGNKTSSTTNNTIVSGTGTVYLDGNNLSFTEPFTISSPGTTVGGIIQGAIRNPTGINTLGGPITLAGNATIISTGTGTSDSLLITGNINTGSSTYILNLDVTKGVRLSNVISGTGGFTKNGSDTLLLYNTGANTYSGITTINGGVVRINSASAFGNASSTSTAHTNITAGTLLIDISGFTIAEPFTIAGDGITLSGVSQGAIKTLYGKNNLTGKITLGASAKILSGIFSGTTSDSLNLDAIETSSTYALTIFTNVGTKAKGVISGTGSLIKEGLDTLLLSAVNTYTGSTKITSGSLYAGITNALSTGSEFIFNGGAFSSGGYSNTLGKLSVLDNSKLNIRYLQVHGTTFTGAASFVAGKYLVIYGWSGLSEKGISKTGELIASNPDQVLVYLRNTGDIGRSKSGGLTKYGQVVSASIGADNNGRIYFTNSTRLTDFQKNRIRFYADSSSSYTSSYRYFSSTQNSSTFELLANDTIKTEPVDVIPTSSLTTNTISSIANTSAISGGNINATTDDVVIARGVVWSTTSSPTVDLSTKTVDGFGSGTFTSNISGLTLSTTYYVRAYATNSNRTDYGPQISFTTLSTPILSSTTSPTSISASTATSGGNISSANGFAMQTRGVVWSTLTNPTIALSTKTAEASTAIGSFTANLTGLTANTTYYIRSYATNASGTDYGPQTTFVTLLAPSGLTSATASTSAYAIKQAYPASTSGLYWIQNANINSGIPIQIYADMTTLGGGWTLIMQNNYYDWTFSNALLRNQTSAPSALVADNTFGNAASNGNYSIIGWADYIKKSASGFDYMIDAQYRGRNGGAWTANSEYSFVGRYDGSSFGTDVVSGNDGFRQNITLISSFNTGASGTGTWSYNTSGLEKRMPWYANNGSNISFVGNAVFTTTNNDSGSWWGTLMTQGTTGWSPAPYQSDGDPKVIWYWVR